MCQKQNHPGGCEAAGLEHDEHGVVTMNGDGADQHAAHSPHRPGAAADSCGTVLPAQVDDLCEVDDLWQVSRHRDCDPDEANHIEHGYLP
jgi:hypothetical protein